MSVKTKFFRMYPCPICHREIKDRKEKRIGTHAWRNHLKNELRIELMEDTPVQFNKIFKDKFWDLLA